MTKRPDKTIHRWVEPVRTKVIQKIIEKREENLSLEKIANLCGISKVQIFDLVNGNKGII
jgi:hypothetical protein